MFIRGLERQLVVTSGLKKEVGGCLDILETLAPSTSWLGQDHWPAPLLLAPAGGADHVGGGGQGAG